MADKYYITEAQLSRIRELFGECLDAACEAGTGWEAYEDLETAINVCQGDIDDRVREANGILDSVAQSAAEDYDLR